MSETCKRCAGSGTEPTRRRARSSTPIPIAWMTCPHCGARYDEGNPFACFSHRNRECVSQREATP